MSRPRYWELLEIILYSLVERKCNGKVNLIGEYFPDVPHHQLKGLPEYISKFAFKSITIVHKSFSYVTARHHYNQLNSDLSHWLERTRPDIRRRLFDDLERHRNSQEELEKICVRVYAAMYGLGQQREPVSFKRPREVVDRKTMFPSPPDSEMSLKERIGGSHVVPSSLAERIAKVPVPQSPLFLPAPEDEYSRSPASTPSTDAVLHSSVTNITIVEAPAVVEEPAVEKPAVEELSIRVPARCPDCDSLIGNNDGSLKYHRDYRCTHNPEAPENNKRRQKKRRMYLERHKPDAIRRPGAPRNWELYWSKMSITEQEEIDRELSEPSEDGHRRRSSLPGDTSFDSQGSRKRPRLSRDASFASANESDDVAEKRARLSNNPSSDSASDRLEAICVAEEHEAGVSPYEFIPSDKQLSDAVQQPHDRSPVDLTFRTADEIHSDDDHLSDIVDVFECDVNSIQPVQVQLDSTMMHHAVPVAVIPTQAKVDSTAHDWLRLETLNDLVLDDLPTRSTALLNTMGHITLLTKIEFLVDGVERKPERSALSRTVIRHLADDDSGNGIWPIIADQIMADQDTLRWNTLVPKLKIVLAG